MNINADWHTSHKMPKNPSLNQRIEWHEQHALHCKCCPIPPKLLEVMKQQRPKE